MYTNNPCIYCIVYFVDSSDCVVWVQYCIVFIVNLRHIQGYLVHKETPTPLGLSQGSGHRLTVGSYEGALSYGRGDPVHEQFPRASRSVRINFVFISIYSFVGCCSELTAFLIQGIYCELIIPTSLRTIHIDGLPLPLANRPPCGPVHLIPLVRVGCTVLRV